MTRYFYSKAALLVLLFSFCLNHMVAQDAVSDEIVAVIEDKVVLKSELDTQYQLFLIEAKQSNLPADQEKNIKKEILWQIINEHILTSEAKSSDIEISTADIDKELEQVIDRIKSNFKTEAEFKQALAKENLTIEKLQVEHRNLIRDRLYKDEYIRSVVVPKIVVSDEEIEEYFKTNKSAFGERPKTMNLSQIVLDPYDNANSQDPVKTKIGEIYQEILAGLDFSEAAVQYSEGPYAKDGGDMGFFIKRGDTFKEFEDAAFGLDNPGDISEPFRTKLGYHIVKLVEKKEGAVQVMQILLLKEKTDQEKELALAAAEDVRNKIIEENDFDKYVKLYSIDEDTKPLKGLIGDIAIDNLPDNIKGILSKYNEGDIVEPLFWNDNLYIFKVNKVEHARPYKFHELKDQIKGYLRQEKLGGEIDKLLDKLKEKYYFEIYSEDYKDENR